MNEIGKRYAVGTKFCNVLDFLDMTKKGYSGDDREVTALFDASLLVLDDIGVQMSKEWVDTVLYRLVNSRYTNRLPTIYTSNIPVEKLKVDDRISDRIESTTYLSGFLMSRCGSRERRKGKRETHGRNKKFPVRSTTFPRGNTAGAVNKISIYIITRLSE